MTSIELRTRIATPIERCFDLSLSVDVHVDGMRHSGERAVGGVTSGILGPGDRVRWEATPFSHPPASHGRDHGVRSAARLYRYDA